MLALGSDEGRFWVFVAGPLAVLSVLFGLASFRRAAGNRARQVCLYDGGFVVVDGDRADAWPWPSGSSPASRGSRGTGPSTDPTTACRRCGAAANPQPKPLGPRDHKLQLRVGGQRRSFLPHTPPRWRSSERPPLVVALHMMRDGADGRLMRHLTGLDATADDPMAAPDAPVSANDLLWRFFKQHPRRR